MEGSVRKGGDNGNGKGNDRRVKQRRRRGRERESTASDIIRACWVYVEFTGSD